MDWLAEGLVSGAVYALVALGLSLLLGIMKVVNLAHGSFYALGAFLAYTLNARWGINPPAALPVAMGAAFLLGAGTELIAIRPVRLHPTTVAVVTLTFGILMEQVMLLVWGPFYLSIPTFLPTLSLGGSWWNLHQLTAAGLAVAIIAVIFLFLRTMAGLAVRLVAEDEEQATLVGIDVDKVQTVVFGLSCALAAAGGALTAPLRAIYPTMGRVPMIVSLAIVILGGLGNIEGSLYAGAIFGLASYLIGLYLGAQWSYIGALALIIVSLVVRPAGLLGRAVLRD